MGRRNIGEKLIVILTGDRENYGMNVVKQQSQPLGKVNRGKTPERLRQGRLANGESGSPNVDDVRDDQKCSLGSLRVDNDSW